MRPVEDRLRENVFFPGSTPVCAISDNRRCCHQEVFVPVPGNLSLETGLEREPFVHPICCVGGDSSVDFGILIVFTAFYFWEHEDLGRVGSLDVQWSETMVGW